MNTPGANNTRDRSIGGQNREVLNPEVIISLVLKNWYILIITVVLAFFCSRFYINHTMRVYKTSTTILVNETGDRSMVNNDQFLQGLGLPAGMRNLDNQLNILKSRELTAKTLEDLPFEIEYYFRTIKNTIPLYPDSPVKLLFDGETPLPRNTEFSISYLGNNMFNIRSQEESYTLNKTASFSEDIEVPGGVFRIVMMNENWLETNKDRQIYLVINSDISLIRNYNRRLSIMVLSRTGSIIEISLTGTNSSKDADFLNKFTEVFQSISLNRKNLEANRRIQFIDDQLEGISDSLILTETRLQQFRSAHRVMDLSAQGQAIISQVTQLDNERARLDLEANYYDYLADYLSKDVSGEIPIVPITMGINDPGLSSLVTTLADLQGQLSASGGGEMNPLQGILLQRIRTTKDALRETLNGLRRANSLAMSENQKQIAKVNAQASTLPSTERQLLGFERKFRLNDELYTFLLQMRSEQQMQKASNIADSEVVDPADSRFSIVVSPNTNMVILLGSFTGFAIPLLIIIMNFLLNKKLKNEDIRRITDFPIVGNIPRNSEKTTSVAIEYPNSTIAEAYRLMRSRMQFFVKDTTSPVILITSSMPGEGKTFTSINLASVYSLLGKKTILVGFDLRKPRLYQDFDLHNDKGVSTWLIGSDGIEEIIQQTRYENLSIITGGPIPPNPSELIALERTYELIRVLKERYDYIIIDSSPIGIVSDTYHLASLSDAVLLVVRPGFSYRDILGVTLQEIVIQGVKGLGLVINDNKSDNVHYGYGHKYGYTTDKGVKNKIKIKRQIRLKSS